MLKNRLALWLSPAVCLMLFAAAVAQDQPAQDQPADEKAEKAASQPAADAQDKPPAEGESASGPQAKVLVTNLDNPCGLAIHPETGHLFIATRVAVYHYAPQEQDREKKIGYHIIGFPTDIYGKGPEYQIGALGLAFFDNKHLVVGGGSRPDGEELLHVFEIDESADHDELKPIQEDDAKFTLGPIAASDMTARGEGNFYGVAVIEKSVFITCNGDDTYGWVARTQFQDDQFGDLELYIPTKQKTAEKLGDVGVDAPGPATVSPDGKELVIGQKGEVNIEADSLLTTYNPETGELTGLWQTDLNDIVGLAYDPKNGDLYCTDFSWVKPEAGALYRLKIDGEELQSEKVMNLDKPTARAFDKDGNLYVTIFGTAEEQEAADKKAPGKLLRISAQDLTSGGAAAQ